MLRTPLVSVATVLLFALVGCGDDSKDESDSEIAMGETIEGTGYTYVVPEGWGVPSEDTGAVADTVAADKDDKDGFADNVNVVASPAGKITPEQVEEAGVPELEAAGATDVSVNDRRDIADSESAHLSAVIENQGIEYAIDQFYVSQDDKTFIVTFSFSTDISEDERTEVIDPVLASWSWTD